MERGGGDLHGENLVDLEENLISQRGWIAWAESVAGGNEFMSLRRPLIMSNAEEIIGRALLRPVAVVHGSYQSATAD